MEIGAAFVADGQSPKAVEPGERAFDHPAMLTQSPTGVDALAGDATDDPTTAQGQATAGDIVRLRRAASRDACACGRWAA